jgi:hypothetical protein
MMVIGFSPVIDCSVIAVQTPGEVVMFLTMESLVILALVVFIVGMIFGIVLVNSGA